jgi:DNA/RNA endonuclease YhcR with UshA esterase domain
MKLRFLVLALALTLVFPGSTLFAHHSTAMYNMANPTTVTGTVKRFEWTNPHAYIYLEVKDESGNTTEWAIEMMSLNHLKSYGWSRNTVQPGEVITCTGGAAKSGDRAMLSSLVKLANGDVIKS